MKKAFLTATAFLLALSDASSQGVSRNPAEDPILIQKQEVKAALGQFEDRFNAGDYFSIAGDVDIEYDVVRADVDPSRAPAIPLNARGREYLQNLLAGGQAPSDTTQTERDTTSHIGARHPGIPGILEGVDLQAALTIEGIEGVRLAPDHVIGIRRAFSSLRYRKDITTAASDYTMQERRVMTFQLQHMMRGLHPLARLVLQPDSIVVQGNLATVETAYEVRSLEARDRMKGHTTVYLVRVGDEWRVRNAKELVGLLWEQPQ